MNFDDELSAYEEMTLFDEEHFMLDKRDLDTAELFESLEVNDDLLLMSEDVMAHLKDTYNDVVTELHQHEEFKAMVKDAEKDELQRDMLVAVIKVKHELNQAKATRPNIKVEHKKKNIKVKPNEIVIPSGKNDSEILDHIYNRKDINYLEFYTKSIIYLIQKYGRMTADELAKGIGGVKAKQLYDVLNALIEFKVLKKEHREFEICTGEPIPEPVIDISNIEDDMEKVQEEIRKISNQLEENERTRKLKK